MDALYTGIKDLLDGLIPSALLSDFQGLNDILAYFLTIGFIYVVLLRPLLRIFGLKVK